MNLIDRIKLKFIKRKYNKLMDEQYKRIKEQEKAINDYLINEVDRKLERTDKIIADYKKVFSS
jgi:hypothetical protein